MYVVFVRDGHWQAAATAARCGSFVPATTVLTDMDESIEVTLVVPPAQTYSVTLAPLVHQPDLRARAAAADEARDGVTPADP